MPRYAASRTLAAPVEQVWAVLADPARFRDWWPRVERAESTVRRALAPGALWQVEGSNRPSIFRQPELTGSLLVLEVVPLQRVVFQLSGERMDVELGLRPVEDSLTEATLVVEASRLSGVRRPFPSQALARLAALVRTEAE